MALMPARVKYRKHHRGKVRGNATRGNTVSYGEYGLQVLKAGWISGRQIEAGRMCASHFLQRQGRVFIRIFRTRAFPPSRWRPALVRAKANQETGSPWVS